MSDEWIDLGGAEALAQRALQRVMAEDTPIALSCVNGVFGAVHSACNHVGGPLGNGTLEGDYIVCPWHQWKFHRQTGVGEPGFEDDRVPAFPVRVENGRVLVNLKAATKRSKAPHEPHPLARAVSRVDGPVRVAGLSTTAMQQQAPRYSGSDHLLESALSAAKAPRLRNATDQAQSTAIPRL